MDYVDLTPAEARKALLEDPELVVLDVRTEPEYRMHRIDGATLLPVQELPQRIGELDPGRRYVVTCEHGVRSRMACSLMGQHGFGDIRNVVGGMARWVGEGLPVTRG
jgi:rhodanese-related sulfurtransferase